MSHFRKIVEIQDLLLDIYTPDVQDLLPDATSVSFHRQSAYNVERAFAKLQKDMDTISGEQIRDS
jgi:hypothetical protein